MSKFVLDTNLYVDAFRNRDAAAALRRFYATFTPNTYLSSVVLHELLVGANTLAKRRQIQEEIARPLKRTRRLLTPSHGAWEMAAEGLRRLAGEDKLDLRGIPKSLVADFLLAASCREAGVTLITDNIRDFRGIRRFVALDFLAPWPT